MGLAHLEPSLRLCLSFSLTPRSRSEALDVPSRCGEGDTAEKGHANGQGRVGCQQVQPFVVNSRLERFENSRSVDDGSLASVECSTARIHHAAHAASCHENTVPSV